MNAPVDQFTVDIGDFSGPLDVLLEFIEKRKLSISDVSLAQVTDDYVAFIERMGKLPVGETAEFLVVASTLLLAKSKALLPNLELTDEEESDIELLEARLKTYREAKRAARLLKKQWNAQPLFLPQKVTQTEPMFTPTEDLTVKNIHTGALALLSALPTFVKKKTAHIKKVINLDEMIDRLTARIQGALTDTFSNVTKESNKAESIIGFLALLELVKRGFVHAAQEGTFNDITIEHKDRAHE